MYTHEKSPTPQLFAFQGAQVKHFSRTQGQRDQFGHRQFTSAELAYLDHRQDYVKAALLISTVGEQFLKKHPGILRVLSEVLEKLSQTELSMTSASFTYPSLKLDLIGHGNFSQTWKIRNDAEPLAFKVPYQTRTEKRLQPYSNEMLQVATFSRDCALQLKQLEIRLPTYYFASGQIEACAFIEGITPNPNRFFDQTLNPEESYFQKKGLGWQLHQLTQEYIYAQSRRNPQLWDGVHADVMSMKTLLPKCDNFIETSDGSLYWIDPFYYL